MNGNAFNCEWDSVRALELFVLSNSHSHVMCENVVCFVHNYTVPFVLKHARKKTEVRRELCVTSKPAHLNNRIKTNGERGMEMMCCNNDDDTLQCSYSRYYSTHLRSIIINIALTPYYSIHFMPSVSTSTSTRLCALSK